MPIKLVITVFLIALLASCAKDRGPSEPQVATCPDATITEPEAVVICQEAAKGSAEAQFQLASLYSVGDVALLDHVQAVYWLSQAFDEYDFDYDIQISRKFAPTETEQPLIARVEARPK